MTEKRIGLWLVALAVSVVANALLAGTVIRQHPRDLPTYPAARQTFGDIKAKVAVCPLPIVGELIVRALTNDGCRVVSAVPQCGRGLESRPDCILEPISLVSNTERDGATVDLVTVLIVRVRKPTALGEVAQGRTFQGASRIKLGVRVANARGETMTTQQEIADGVRQAVENLMRIPALKTSILQAG